MATNLVLSLAFHLFRDNFIRMKDTSAEVTLPKAKIHAYESERKDKLLCPKSSPIYINETDNSLLCRRVVLSDRDFPFQKTVDDSKTDVVEIRGGG